MKRCKMDLNCARYHEKTSIEQDRSGFPIKDNKIEGGVNRRRDIFRNKERGYDFKFFNEVYCDVQIWAGLIMLDEQEEGLEKI